jgi:molybdopterin synthase sulfur carrier subunit
VKIEVRLFATLTAFLPPHSREGAALLDVSPGSTVRDVVRGLGIPADLERVCLVNGDDAGPERVLQPGDVLTVFPPLAGGRDDHPDAPVPGGRSGGRWYTQWAHGRSASENAGSV